MTKQHFQAVAEILNGRFSRATRLAEMPLGKDVGSEQVVFDRDRHAAAGARQEIRHLAGALAGYFAEENPRFDRNRFLAAALG